MKRFISILLAFCILFTNTGWALSAHYCMGERVGINLRHASIPQGGAHECSKCGMKKSAADNGCCQDQEVIIKSTQDALLTVFSIHLSVNVADLPIQDLNFRVRNCPEYVVAPILSFQPHGPPGDSGLPMYIRICVFLI